ncbi:Proteasome subunit alpha type-2, partial [Lobosporangium transversale]
MADRYSFSLTTFSPSGKLVQIEYALNAVNSGVTSIGIKAIICSNIGMVYSGMGPDYRVLVNKARKAAQAYKRVYMEEPPTAILVKEIASVMQEFTQSGNAIFIDRKNHKKAIESTTQAVADMKKHN